MTGAPVLPDAASLFAWAPAPMLVLAPDAPRFTITEVNAAYLAAVMRTRAELIGRGVFEAMPDNPDDPEASGVANLRASIERAIASKRPDTMPLQKYDVQRPDGSFDPRWWHPINAPVLDARGEVVAIIHHVGNATQRVLAEQAIREREQRLHGVLDGMTEGFGLLAPDFTILEHNAEALRLGGRSREQVIGRSHWDVYPGSERSELGRLLRKAMAERVPVTHEHCYPLANGRLRWLDMRAYPTSGGALAMFWRDVTDRKDAETALRATAERNVEILESISDAFYAVDAEWRFTYLNRQTERWWRRSRESLIGKVYWEELPDAVGSELYEAHLRAAANREVVRLEAKSPTVARWLDISIYPAADGGLSVYFRDIADRKAAEERLRETSRRLDAILNNTREAVFLMDHRQHCIYANAAAEALTGYRFDEMQGRPLHDVVHHKRPDGSHYPLEECPIDRAFPERAQMSGEELFVHKDGSFYPVAFTASPMLDDHGKPIGTVIEARNIAERKAREAALLESEARVRALTDNLPAGLVYQMAARADGSERRFLYISQGYEKLTGVPTQAVIADPSIPYSLILPEDRPRLSAAEAEGLRTRRPFDVAVRFRHTSGAVRWSRIIAAPRPQPDGSIVWDGIQIDTTEQKTVEAALRELNETLETRVAERSIALEQAHEQLRQSQKLEAMGQLTGGVSHDFNNLLSPIIGSLDLLQRKGVGGERERRMIDGALQSAERARVLVQRLLAFARRQPLQPQAVAIGTLVRGMADLVASTTGPQIKVVVDVGEDLPAAVADPNQIEMAILNLAVNARDAMENGGTLRISADSSRIGKGHRSNLAPGRYVRLSVADTGSGMDEETLRRAIEPFFSTKGIGRGTGLGLSMVHGLAAQLGGTLTIESQPGLGTNVEIWLPASEEAACEAEPADDGDVRPQAGTALLVDDEELVRRSTADMLVELGYVVVQASSAEEALQHVARGLAFDVLVTDHLMPGMTGTELAREVQERRPGVQVLVVSGYSDVEGVAPDLARLLKPFRQADLAASLAALAAERG